MFADYGVQDAKVVYDQQSGRSKGIAFLTFASAEQATKAQAAMNGAVRGARGGGAARHCRLGGSWLAAWRLTRVRRRRRSWAAATSAWRRASRRASAIRSRLASRASSA